ncbi:unnamed protein product [Thelazia callipaeda]|uniref:RNase_PH domain-containing protein n=1 Tax=Thelazia callipaeda TaxID=103827 RepID=A0A0N5D7N7_THECL|nr:unnamed protein product [Thelazia callipaeda]
MLHSSVKPVSLTTLLRRKKKSGDKEIPENYASDSFRPTQIEVGNMADKKGSAYVEFGSTKVICAIDGPKEVTKTSDAEYMDCKICVFYRNTSSSAIATASNTSNKQNSTIRSAIESTLRSMVCLDLFCKAQIDVEITVIEDDGGVLAVALIASCLALVDSGIQLYDVCVAAHIVMLADGRVIVDPPNSLLLPSSGSDSKDLLKNAHLSVTVGIMPSLNQLTCCDFVGIATPVQLKRAIAAAVENSIKLYPLIRKTLENRAA